MPTPASAEAYRARGYFIGLCAAAILGTTSVIIRYLTLTYHIPALVLTFWRDVFTVATLVLIFLVIRPGLLKVPRAQLPFLVVYGLVMALFNLLWTLSVSLNGAAVATVLAYCSAAFTVFLARLFLAEPLNAAKLLATALCLGGCVLVSGAHHAEAWRSNFLGILTGTVGGLSYAAYTLMGRAAAGRGLDPWTTLLYIFMFATGFLFLLNLPQGGPLHVAAAGTGDFFWLGRAMAGWGILFLLSAGPTVSGFGLYLVTLKHLPSSVTSLVVSLEPVFTTFYAFLFLGEVLGPAQVGGGVMVLSGVALLRIHEIRLGQAAARAVQEK
jgi:drug/metabolite transporter (DMT)-like permease